MLKNKDGFYTKMLKLALPIALQNLLSSCAYLIDTAMVISLGNSATAAVGVATRWNFLLNVTMFGICSGAATLVSQFWGAKEHQKIRDSFGLAVICALLLGAVFNFSAFLFPEQMMRLFTSEAEVITLGAQYLKTVSFYGVFITFTGLLGGVLRAMEDVYSPLISSVSGIVVNTCLNYILIYGKLGFSAMGLRGAATATVIATLVQTLMLIILAIRKKSVIIAPLKKLFGFNRDFVKKFFRIAYPVLLNELLWAFGTNVYNMILARQGSENYASYTTFASIEQVAFVFFVGICHACSIMTGKLIGEGKLKEAKETAIRFVKMTPLIGIIVGTVVILLRYPILSVLPIETEGARQMTANILLVYGCWVSIRMIPYMLVVGTFRAGGDVLIGLIWDSIALYVWGIPIVAFSAFFLHLDFQILILVMYISEDFVKTIYFLHRFRSGKWIRVLV